MNSGNEQGKSSLPMIMIGLAVLSLCIAGGLAYWWYTKKGEIEDSTAAQTDKEKEKDDNKMKMWAAGLFGLLSIALGSFGAYKMRQAGKGGSRNSGVPIPYDTHGSS
mmetsp:Transcript_22069/g.35105  ORF Transcript_22069/g.35105 Transcript_22069/m.35105 type:complete len:107 (+) Transcript_22069:52-372(+)